MQDSNVDVKVLVLAGQNPIFRFHLLEPFHSFSLPPSFPPLPLSSPPNIHHALLSAPFVCLSLDNSCRCAVLHIPAETAGHLWRHKPSILSRTNNHWHCCTPSFNQWRSTRHIGPDPSPDSQSSHPRAGPNTTAKQRRCTKHVPSHAWRVYGFFDRDVGGKPSLCVFVPFFVFRAR